MIRVLTVICPAVLVALPALAQDVEVIDFDNTGPQATKLVILLVAFVAILFLGRKVPLPQMVRSAAVWLAIGIGLVALYASRDTFTDIGRDVMAVMMPGTAFTDGEQVKVRRAYDGHFFLRGEVEGAPVEFVFDTGASSVVLAAADAERAGFDADALDYRIPVMTAAGQTTVAPVRLGEVRVGSIALDGVRAAVARPGDLDRSLLGMTFLNRLSAYEVRRDELILTP